MKKIIVSSLLSMALLFTGCSVDKTNETVLKSESTTNLESGSNIDGVNNVNIHFIDTGNSDAILIKEGSKNVLIDGGDNGDEETIVNYLKKENVEQINYMIATHPHADHIGGLDGVIKNFKVENLFVANGSAETKTYRDFINLAAQKNLSPSVPLENNKFMLENSYFEILNTNGGEETNEQSLVVKFTNGNDKAIFMGDAEVETEKEIINKVEQSDLIKVGHHGSSSSSSEFFIDKINPKYAIITAGNDNKYGHPHKETMETLEDRNITIHRNDECGDIVFKSTGNGFETECKEGSFLSGREKQGSSNKTHKENTSNKKEYKTQSYDDQSIENDVVIDNIVYYTPKGKSYHSTDKCSTLSRSKTILSGSIESSGKNDPCDACVNN